MWFVTDLHNPPLFYQANGTVAKVDEIEWINKIYDKDNNCMVTCSRSFAKNNQQAISALFSANIFGFSNKSDAKEFALNLKLKTWKYINL